MTEQARAPSIFVLRLKFFHYFTWKKDKVVLWSPVRSTFNAGHQWCSRVHSRQNMQSTSLKVMKTSSFFAMWKPIQRLIPLSGLLLCSLIISFWLRGRPQNLSLPAKLHFLVEYSHISNPQRLSAYIPAACRDSFTKLMSDWFSIVNRLSTPTHEELSLIVFAREVGLIKCTSPWRRICSSLVENCSDWQQYHSSVAIASFRNCYNMRLHLTNYLSKILTKGYSFYSVYRNFNTWQNHLAYTIETGLSTNKCFIEYSPHQALHDPAAHQWLSYLLLSLTESSEEETTKGIEYNKPWTTVFISN